MQVLSILLLIIKLIEGEKIFELNEKDHVQCVTSNVTYKLNEIHSFMYYNCTTTNNVRIIGKEQGYGTVEISKTAWNKIKSLEIRHTGSVLIHGGADDNDRSLIIIASCDTLWSNATHWGETTIFESIKNIIVNKIIGKSEKNIIRIRNSMFQDFPAIVGKFMNVEILNSNIRSIAQFHTKCHNACIIKMSRNIIREINSGSIYFSGGRTHFNFKENVIDVIRENSITLFNHFTEMTHNKFHNLAPSWLKLQDKSIITIASNTFYQPFQEITIEGNESMCTFESNKLNNRPNESLDYIYKKCLIHDVKLEQICSCDMKLLHKDQIKCAVQGLEKVLCFDNEYTSIETYHRCSCKDNKYSMWSECGTKTYGLIIGLSSAFLLILLNIVCCYFVKKCYCNASQQSIQEKPTTTINPYQWTSNNTSNEVNENVLNRQSEKSIEFDIHGLKDGMSTIKLSQRPPNFLEKLKLVPLSETGAVTSENTRDESDYETSYYSNDCDFNR